MLLSTATNAAGSVMATHNINVGSPLSGVTIEGPDDGAIGSPYSCQASVSPATAATPITYLWQATGQSPVTHVGGLSDSISFVWGAAGHKTISVTATNPGGSVLNTYAADIGLRELFLPVVRRP